MVKNNGRTIAVGFFTIQNHSKRNKQNKEENKNENKTW